MKKSFKVLLLTMVFVIGCSMPVMARTGKVKADAAVVRADADTSSSAVASTTQGTSLEILGEKKDAGGATWYQISVNGGTGYIRSDLVEAEAATSSDNSQSQTTTTQSNTASSVTPASGTAYMLPGSSNIRNAAVNGEVLVTLQKDDAVTITGEMTGSDGKKWYQVNFVKNSKSYTGFVRSDLITMTAPAGATTQQTTETTETQTTETTEATEVAETQEAQQPAMSASATLKSLTLSVGDLTPEFSPDCVSYTINAPADTVEIAVSAVTGEDGTQITAVDGFSDLKPGLNAGAITVTGADGGINIYSFSIICGEVSQTETAEPVEEVDPAEIEASLLEAEGETVPVEEYNRYKELANRRLIYMCVLGFIVALCIVIIINLILKIRDLTDELESEVEEDDDDDELEVPAYTRQVSSGQAAKSLQKVEQAAKKKVVETASIDLPEEFFAQNEPVAEEAPQVQIQEPIFAQPIIPQTYAEPVMPMEEAPEQPLYDDDDDEGAGVDDDFEFEFINLK